MFSIRPMGPSDVSRVVRIEKEEGAFDPWCEKDFDRALSNSKKTSLVVCDAKSGEVIGHLVAVRGPNKMSILNVLVQKSYRRRGLGRLLMLKAIEIANGRLVSAMVDERNIQAAVFFRALKFRCRLERNFFESPPADAYCFERGGEGI